MTARKKPLKLIVAAVVLIAAAYVYYNFGSMLTRTAEKIASDALGVNVSIGSIDVSLAHKKVTVHSLKVANPKGYRGAYAMTSESIAIGLNSASPQFIDFNDIQVKGTVVNLEVNEKGMNLADLKNLANSKEQKQSAGSEQIRVIVQHMVIDASVINTSIAMLNREIPPIRLPAVTFSNIGKGEGVSANVAIDQVVSRYFSAVENAAQQEGLLNGLPGMNDAKGLLGNAAKKLNGLFR